MFALYCLRLALSAAGGLHPDEAYYWEWSRHLAWGYYDHPPLLAWLIRAGSALLGPASSFNAAGAQLGLRWVPLFFSSVLTPLVLARIIELAQAAPLQPRQAMALLTAPVFVFGPQIITPDAPFFFFWSLSLWLTLRLRPVGLAPGHKTPFQAGRAVSLGIALGLTALSKYSAILAAFLVVVTGAGLANTAVAGLAALLVCAPHFAWHLTQQGAGGHGGILFQLQNGLGDLHSRANFRNLGDVWAIQLVFWSPAVFVGVFACCARAGACRMPMRLATWALTPLLFFSLTALHRPAEGNWPLIGVTAALALVISAYRSRPRKLAWVIVVNLFTGAMAAIIIAKSLWLAPLARPWSPRLAEQLEKPSRLHEFSGWQNLHAQVAAATQGDALPVKAQSYQLLSELLFFDALAAPTAHLGARLKIWNGGSRVSQYDAWPEYVDAGESFWLVTIGNSPTNPPQCPLVRVLLKGARAFRVMRCGP